MLKWYILAIIIALGVFALLMYSLYKSDQYKNKILETSRYEVNTRTAIDNSIPSALSTFIDDCFTDYQILVLLPRNELYITEERENQILEDLCAKVAERMSPDFKQKMHQYYNPDTFDKVLSDKIFIAVVNYCLSVNTNIRTSDKES